MDIINRLQAISRIAPKNNSQWCTFVFIMNSNTHLEDGSPDPLKAYVLPLSSFPSQREAEQYLKDIEKITGPYKTIVVKHGHPAPITWAHKPENTVILSTEDERKLVAIESERQKTEKELYEKHMKDAEEVEKDIVEERNPDSLETLIRNIYFLVKNRKTYEKTLEEAEQSKTSFQKRESLIREHFKTFPEHEEQWKPYLKKKLTSRGELSLYESIEREYALHHNSKDREIDNIECECPGGVCMPPDNSK